MTLHDNSPREIGTLLTHAYAHAQAGLDVFPVNPHSKAPLESQYHATTDLEVVEQWWKQWPDALIGHRISPFHIILDIDPRHGGKETWTALKAEMPAFETRVHYSGRGDGGGHVWFQRPDEHMSVTKLDQWAREHGTGHQLENTARWTSGIDLLQHDHRYTILPPSPHPETRKPYRWTDGQGTDTPIAPLPQLLCDLLVVEPAISVDDNLWQRREPPNPSNSIADWYSSTASWPSLLGRHGWILVAGTGDSDGSRWRHPTATTAHSATIRYGCLFVYSSNTPFDVTAPGDVHGYTLFHAFAVLEHGGDQRAAARAARALKSGGSQASAKPLQTSPASATFPAAPDIEPVDDPTTENAPPRQIQFRTIAELAAEVDARPHPGWLARPVWPADSYGVIGAEQKLGKTWMVLDLVVSVASEGVWLEAFSIERSGPVLVFLGEGGDRKMLRRMRAIGAAKNVAIEGLPIHLAMRVPHLTNEDHLEEMRVKIDAVKPVLVVIDPLYLAAKGAKGSDLYAMGEHLEAVQHVTQAAGAALVIVHHWNKTGDGVGASRMSGVGPGEWGRVLVSASTVARSTDPITMATDVLVNCEFTGDEIPEMTMRYRRKVWTFDNADLSSAMGYRVELVENIDAHKHRRPSDTTDVVKAEVLEVLTRDGSPMSKDAICSLVNRQRVRTRETIDALIADGTLYSVGSGARRKYAVAETPQSSLIVANGSNGMIVGDD